MPRRLAVCLISSLLMVSAYLPASALATSIPHDILTEPGPFSPTKLDQIRKLVGQIVKKMDQAKSPAGMREARSELLQPLDKQRYFNSTPAFCNAWSGEVARQLLPGMNGDNPVMKVNILYTAGYLYAGLGAQLVQKGLESDDPGIRYWAAKSIVVMMIAKRNQDVLAAAVPPRYQKELMDSLLKIMATEKSSIAMEEMYSALGALRIPGARPAMLDMLTQRLNHYNNGVNDAIRAEREGIYRLYFALRRDEGKGDLDKELLQKFVVLCVKYAQLDRHAMSTQKQMPPALRTACLQLFGNVQDVFAFGMRIFAPDEYAKITTERNGKTVIIQKLNMIEALNMNRELEIPIMAGDWITMLMNIKALGIDKDDLKFPGAKPEQPKDAPAEKPTPA